MERPPKSIYRTEPMATRALAAEIRHQEDQGDGTVVDLLIERLKITRADLGDLVDIVCEEKDYAKLDVVLVFENGSRQTTVGIEAKFDHYLSKTQFEKERRAVNHLALLLIDEDHKPTFVPDEVPVLTWELLLGMLTNSRLTDKDIAAMPPSKAAVDGWLYDAEPAQHFPPCWNVEVARNGSGMPAVKIESPPLANGRRLLGQVQVTGQGALPSLDRVLFEFFIGISVEPTEFPVRKSYSSRPPEWIKSLRRLRGTLTDPEFVGMATKKSARGHWSPRSGKAKTSRVDVKGYLISKHLPKDDWWLGTGYTDWAIGPYSTLVDPEPVGEHPFRPLRDLCRLAADLMLAWFDAEVAEVGLMESEVPNENPPP